VINEKKDVDVPAEIFDLPTIDLNILRINQQDLQNPEYISGTGLKNHLKFVDPDETTVSKNYSEYGLYGTDVFWSGLEKSFFTVNGDESPIVEIVKNEWTRIRVVYASTAEQVLLRLFDQATGRPAPSTSCQTRMIAKDGTYVPNDL